MSEQHQNDHPINYVMAIQQEAVAQGMLPMWTVYDHPTDIPNKFVARCHVVMNGESGPTNNWITASTLHNLRMMLRMAGLTCLPRSPEDNAKIVETWL